MRKTDSSRNRGPLADVDAEGLRQLIRHQGGAAKLAATLGVDEQTITRAAAGESVLTGTRLVVANALAQKAAGASG